MIEPEILVSIHSFVLSREAFDLYRERIINKDPDKNILA